MFCDLTMARRVEAADAAGGVAFVRSCARLLPDAGAASEAILGGQALFSGRESPVNQALGVGLDGPATAAEMSRLEDFFFHRGVPVVIEVVPFVEASFLELLAGYRPSEFSNVSLRPVGDGTSPGPAADDVQVEVVAPGDGAAWARTVMLGFAEGEELPPAVAAIMAASASAEGAIALQATLDGAIAGGGLVQVADGVAIFSGQSTLPRLRRRGVQNALYRESLALARQHGCDLAAVMTAPGSGSQHNAERHGFRVAYTRVKMVREPAVRV